MISSQNPGSDPSFTSSLQSPLWLPVIIAGVGVFGSGVGLAVGSGLGSGPGVHVRTGVKETVGLGVSGIRVFVSEVGSAVRSELGSGPGVEVAWGQE